MVNKFDILTEIIRSRRAIFPQQYVPGAEIDDEIVLKILDNAIYAPSHKRTQPWRFKIIKGEGRKKMSEFAGAWYLENHKGDDYSEIKYKKHKENPLKASHIIAICMKRDASSSLPEWEELAAVACAVQNIWLSCAALGIGSYWSTPPSIYASRDFLRLEEDEKCIGWFYLGYPQSNLELSAVRDSLDTKINWISK